MGKKKKPDLNKKSMEAADMMDPVLTTEMTGAMPFLVPPVPGLYDDLLDGKSDDDEARKRQ